MKTIITFLVLGISTFLGAQGLVINEFVADNDSSHMIYDEFGEYDDWVELYNNSEQSIDMSGYFLSDDFAEPNKWQFPAGVSIPGEGYLIVWTDGDDNQGDLHTNFRLSKDGEQLILSDNFLSVLDSVTFGAQAPDVSFARFPNGTGDFTFRIPSFGENNNTTGVFVNNIVVRTDFEIFPNPTQSDIHIDFSNTKLNRFSEKAILEIIDFSGKVLFTKQYNETDLNGLIKVENQHLVPGMYTLKVRTDSEIFMKKFVAGKK